MRAKSTALIRECAVCGASWPPCAACGDPDGPIGAHGKTPTRFKGARVGVDGELCSRCYSRITSAMRYRAHVISKTQRYAADRMDDYLDESEASVYAERAPAK